MKKTRLITVVMALFVSFAAIYAQNAQEIQMAKAMASQYGYSASEVDAILAGRNSGNANSGNVADQTVNRTVAGDPRKAQNLNVQNIYDIQDTTGLGMTDFAEVKKEIFGKSIFFSPNLNFIPNYNIPTPEKYKLAPGDEIVIDIWGATYMNYKLTISPEGKVTVPNLGPVYLSGQTISQAENLMRRHLGRIYSGMDGNDPDTFMSLTLGRIRSLSINVVGDATSPGTYVLPSLSTVFAALYQAGGPNELGSLRNIRLYRNGKENIAVDIYDFLINGDLSKNVRLEDNDLIVIEPYSCRVQVDGSVKRPMIYDMKGGETIADLLRYCAGFSETANDQLVVVLRTKGPQAATYTVKAKDFGTFKLEDGDQVTAPRNIERNVNRVTINGAVWNPGVYALDEENRNLSSLIRLAGGLRDDAYMQRGYIQRYDENRYMTAVNFSPADVIAGVTDVTLKSDDVVRIYKTEELEVKGTVKTYGALRKPGEIEYRNGLTLGDVILLSGGYDNGASVSNIEVGRRKISDVPTDSSSLVYRFNIAENPEQLDFILEMNDMIFVRNAPDYRNQTSVTIRGEVVFPGEYVVERNVVRISDIIKRCGGLTNSAYVPGATVTRVNQLTEVQKKEKMERKKLLASDKDSVLLVDEEDHYNVAVNLEKALANPGSLDDLILVNADVINIPQMNNTVKISGGVYSPNVIVYNEKFGYRDYIKQVGGYMKGAKRGQVYVINMNGTVETSKPLKVMPGSEIVVPYEKPNEKSRVTVAEFVSIATGVASLATIAVTLVNLLTK